MVRGPVIEFPKAELAVTGTEEHRVVRVGLGGRLDFVIVKRVHRHIEVSSREVMLNENAEIAAAAVLSASDHEMAHPKRGKTCAHDFEQGLLRKVSEIGDVIRGDAHANQFELRAVAEIESERGGIAEEEES